MLSRGRATDRGSIIFGLFYSQEKNADCFSDFFNIKDKQTVDKAAKKMDRILINGNFPSL